MEYGTAEDIFYDPQHPYTWSLMASMPDMDLEPGDELSALHGAPPNMLAPPEGAFPNQPRSLSSFRFRLLAIRRSRTLGRSTLGAEGWSIQEVYFKGKLISGKLSPEDKRMVHQEIQMIFQDPISSLNPRMTIKEIIGEGLLINKLVSSEDELSGLPHQAEGLALGDLEADVVHGLDHDLVFANAVFKVLLQSSPAAGASA